MRLRFFAVLILMLGAWLAAPVAEAANRVVNPDFDVDASDWPGDGVFDPALDADDDPASGSLHVQNDVPMSGKSSIQRFTITSAAPLRVSSCTRIASGQSAQGIAEVGLNFWEGSCEAIGNYIEFVETSLLAMPFDTWVCTEVPELVPPAGAGCVEVTLFVRNDGMGGEPTGNFGANFDAIFAPEPQATASGLVAVAAMAARLRRPRRRERSA